jgi:hypothetical protein
MADGQEGRELRLWELEHKVDDLSDAVGANTLAIEEMVAVWKSAKHLVSFIFLCAKLGAAISLIWGYFQVVTWIGKP